MERGSRRSRTRFHRVVEEQSHFRLQPAGEIRRAGGRAEPSGSSGWGLGIKGREGAGREVGVVGVKGKLEEMVFCLFDCYLLLCRNVHDALLFVLSRHISSLRRIVCIKFSQHFYASIFFVLLNFYCVEGK